MKAGPAKRIHFDRFEVFLVMGLFSLVCALVFLLGVLVGYGIGPGNVGAQVAHLSEGTHEALGGHGHEEAERRPAAIEEDAEPGSKLRKALRDSKQLALNELVKKEAKGGDNTPRSVLDASAHLGMTAPPENRSPAMADPITPDVKKVEAVEKEPPRGVASLFDKKPKQGGWSPKRGEYTVQVASFASEDEAKSRVAVLRKAGYNDAYFQSNQVKNGETWFRVGVGSFQNADWAKKTGEKLLGRGLAKDYVVKEVH